MPYQCIFLDLDDTIWDFHANAREALHEVFEVRSLGNHFDHFEQFFQLYAEKNLELWERYGKGEITKDFLKAERFRYPLAYAGVYSAELAEQMGEQYLKLLPTKKILKPFAKELLDYLHPKYPLTIISNGFVEVQYTKLRSANLEHYFQHIVLSEAAGALKPDKQIFEYALALNHATAKDAIMIGDSYEADIRGAQNAGIDHVYYPLNTNEDLTNKPATHTIFSLKEVFDIL